MGKMEEMTGTTKPKALDNNKPFNESHGLI